MKMKMESQINEVGAFEAKTKLAELIRETERGSSFLIVRRGKPVARLIPVEPDADTDYVDFVAAFREIRKEIPGPVDIRALIEEGRR